MSDNVGQRHKFSFVAAVHNFVVERGSDVVMPITLDLMSAFVIARQVLVQDVHHCGDYHQAIAGALSGMVDTYRIRW